MWTGFPIRFNMLTLKDAKKMQIYEIVGFKENSDSILRRFMELGFTVGQKLKIISTSLQKKVFLIEIRGYLLSVRASLLDGIFVKEVRL